MRILAIETVDKTGSVAALEGATLLEQRRLEAPRRSAQSLAPAIAELLSQIGWRGADVQLVAVASGPPPARRNVWEFLAARRAAAGRTPLSGAAPV